MSLFAKVVVVSVYAMTIASVPQNEFIDLDVLSQLFEESGSNTTSEPLPETEFTTSSTLSKLPEAETTNPNDHPKITSKSFTSPKSSEKPPLRLPDWDLDWQQIREKNFLYIDKTPYLIKLLERNTVLCFLTRPRRFGKTTFVDMMSDFFRGEKDLFGGLAVDKEGNTKYFAKSLPKTEGKLLPKWMEFPVIHLNLAQIAHFKTEEVFDVKFREKLEDIATSYKIDISRRRYFDLSNLIEALHDKFNKTRVIILVDEYDHPFQYALLRLQNRGLAQYVLDFLESIFTVIKSMVRKIGRVFVTGVSKLGILSLESGGSNAFIDLTFDRDFAGAFGLTESEIKSNLGPYVTNFAQNICTKQKANKDIKSLEAIEDDIFQELRMWYDGYQFSDKADVCKVLNPVSTLQSLKNHEFRSYWVSTGSMDYLVHRFYEESRSLHELKQGASILRENLHRRLKPLTTAPSFHIYMLLFGYYTITSYDDTSDTVMLNFPNSEIREAVEYNLARYFPDKNKFIEDFPSEMDQFEKAMKVQNIDEAMIILNDFAFRGYTNPLDQGMNPHDVVRRVDMVFRAANIKEQLSTKFKKDNKPNQDAGDIDLQTIKLEINYIVEVKCMLSFSENLLSGIKQLLRYFKNYPKSFAEAIRNQNSYNLLSMNFFLDRKNATLHSWVLLPCVDGNLNFSLARAKPRMENLKTDLEEVYEKIQPDKTK